MSRRFCFLLLSNGRPHGMVYPRAYGATANAGAAYAAGKGLSPCVRGYLGRAGHGDVAQGSIPVCTGLPRWGFHRSSLAWVYPRVYGATTALPIPISSMRGLSPCVRGYHSRRGPAPSSSGSIPVCTGLPVAPPRGSPARRVYPRVYGATGKGVRRTRNRRGLSPCVRGYHLRARAPRVAHGSIPVCTGLPRTPKTILPKWGVYPRVYGATASIKWARTSPQGLSPCVRGYRRRTIGSGAPDGSIPVCTGLPVWGYRALRLERVYPRVYGATSSAPWYDPFGWGLSPCVRGYPRVAMPDLVQKGSIPVCTGLPGWTRSCGPCMRVYPRVYGATGSRQSGSFDCSGLSPCVRGYPKATAQVLARGGSIPVCTGLPMKGEDPMMRRRVYPRVYGATR